MPELAVQTIDDIITAIGAWAEALDPNVKRAIATELPEDVTREDAERVAEQLLVELATLFSAMIIQFAEATPNPASFPAWAQLATKTLFESLSEDGFETGAIAKIVDRDKYARALASNPEVAKSAKRFGVTVQEASRSMADDVAEQLTQAIRWTVPVIFNVARQPWSTAMLEQRLRSAAPAAPSDTPAAPPPMWAPDPTGRHELRYWNGSQWADDVADAGVQSLDALVAASADDVEHLVAELIDLGRHGAYVGEPGEHYDEHHNHKRARRIGEMLNNLGGMELMLAAHSRVAAEFTASARARELEACWGGVGHWRR
jgi:hypothetical protein